MTNAEKEYINSLIQIETTKLKELENNKSSTFDDKLACLNNIIELKKLINYSKDDSIYLDLKYFFKIYIKTVEEKDNNYDKISLNKIAIKLHGMELNQKISLLNIFRRELLINHYTENITECDKLIQRTKLLIYCKELSFENKLKSIKNIIRIVAIWSSDSLRNLAVCFIIFFLSSSLFFLEAPNQGFHTINYETETFCTSPSINFFLNLLTLFFDLEHGMKIEAVNAFGVLQIILGKIIYLGILINFLVKKASEFIKIID
ncbi:MAG: hypothetical protein U0V03_01045 [Bacteroidia bacterium]